MNLTLDEIYGYRLGSIAETFNSWNDNLSISREAIYQAVAQHADLVHQGIGDIDSSSEDFLDELTQKIHYYRPDLMNAFMLGRAAAQLVILSAKAAAMDYYDSPEWQADWKNTEEAVLFGTSKRNIPQYKAKEWIFNVRNDPRKWHNTEALIT